MKIQIVHDDGSLLQEVPVRANTVLRIWLQLNSGNVQVYDFRNNLLSRTREPAPIPGMKSEKDPLLEAFDAES